VSAHLRRSLKFDNALRKREQFVAASNPASPWAKGSVRKTVDETEQQQQSEGETRALQQNDETKKSLANAFDAAIDGSDSSEWDSNDGEADASDLLLQDVKGAGRLGQSAKPASSSSASKLPHDASDDGDREQDSRGEAQASDGAANDASMKRGHVAKAVYRSALPHAPSLDRLALALSGAMWSKLERTWYQRFIQLQDEASAYLAQSSSKEIQGVRGMLHDIAEHATRGEEAGAARSRKLTAFRTDDDSDSSSLGEDDDSGFLDLDASWLTGLLDEDMADEGDGLVAFRESLPPQFDRGGESLAERHSATASRKPSRARAKKVGSLDDKGDSSGSDSLGFLANDSLSSDGSDSRSESDAASVASGES